jgi:hypothetical protein
VVSRRVRKKGLGLGWGLLDVVHHSRKVMRKMFDVDILCLLIPRIFYEAMPRTIGLGVMSWSYFIDTCKVNH